MVRLMPTSLYNVPALETWLSDQARRGLNLTGFLGERWAMFERGDPAQTAYRLEVSGRGYHPDEEEQALYAQAGWAYVGISPYEDFWVFRAARPDPAPIHTDPEVQALSYRRLQRRLRRRAAVWAALAAVCTGMAAVWLWVLAGCVRQLAADPLLPFMNNAFWLFGLALFHVILHGCDLMSLGRLAKRLGAGVPMEHRGRVLGLRRWGFGGMALLAAVYFYLAFSSIAAYGQDNTVLRWEGPLTECPTPLPCVLVEDLGAVSRKPAPFAAGWRSALAEAYTICDGDITYRGWGETVSGRQGRTEAYRMALPGFSGLALREIVKEELPPGAKRLEDGRFDEVWYGVEPGGAQHLALREGRRVLWMRAEVPEDLRGRLDAFAAALAAFA